MKLYLFAAVLSMCYCLSLATKCSWGDWGYWSRCDCGRGLRVRTRECEPSSYCSEKHCKGSSKEYGKCCCCCLRWSSWSKWSNCKNCKRTRKRKCTYPKPYCKPKCKKEKETEKCPSYWGSWGPCSVTCGRGTQSRTKYCDTGYKETRYCYNHACPCYCYWKDWGDCKWYGKLCEKRRICYCPHKNCIYCVGPSSMSCSPRECYYGG